LLLPEPLQAPVFLVELEVRNLAGDVGVGGPIEEDLDGHGTFGAGRHVTAEAQFRAGGGAQRFAADLDGGQHEIGALPRGVDPALLEFQLHWSAAHQHGERRRGVGVVGGDVLSRQLDEENRLWAEPLGEIEVTSTEAGEEDGLGVAHPFLLPDRREHGEPAVLGGAAEGRQGG